MTLAEFHAANPLYKLLHSEFDAQVLAFVVYMTVLVGFAEELLGRGLIQNALDRRYARVLGRGRFTIRTSTLLAAILFAFWHTQWVSLDPMTILRSAFMSLWTLLPVSLLISVVYEKTRSMLAVIVLHNVWDGGKLVTWYLWSLILPG